MRIRNKIRYGKNHSVKRVRQKECRSESDEMIEEWRLDLPIYSNQTVPDM